MCAASIRARAIARSGTTPEPPAMSCTGDGIVLAPDEVAAERAEHLQRVTGRDVVHQVRRDLAVRHLVDAELDRVARRLRVRANTT